MNLIPLSANPFQAQPIPAAAHGDYWGGFYTALESAIEEIQESYFRVPRFGMDAAWRERAYCYELYHQLRCLLPTDFPYTLHGEIDKIGHANVTRHFGKMKRPNPDFVVHKPGLLGDHDNLVVIEVKRSDADPKLIKQDLWKIRKFVNNVGYQHGIMLFFGEQTPPNLFRLGKIRAIWHNTVGQKPVRSKKGKFQ